MPVKSKKRAPGRKGRRHRRKPRSNQASLLTIHRPVCPDRIHVRLPFSETFSLSGTTLLASRFYQTSMYDPRYAASGNQPLGFDQWAAFFQRYRVYGLGWEVCAINKALNVATDVWVITKSNSTATSGTDLLAEKTNIHKIVGLSGGGAAIKCLKGYSSVARAWGLKKSAIQTDEDFQALTSANPAKMAYLQIYSQGTDMSSSYDVQFRVRLTFYCEFFDRVQLNQS